MRLRMIGAVLGAVMAMAASASAGEIKLTTLDWPPYTGSTLPGKGISTLILRDVLGSANDTAKIEVLPWQRAVSTGLEGDGYVGYYPEYFSAGLEEQCQFSGPIGSSPLGFVERKDAPVAWNELSDLAEYKIGVVNGYVNTEAFDALVAEGRLKAEPVVDDMTNLRKVLAGRIRLAVIDRNVMDFMLASDAGLGARAGELHFNDKLLENKTLHVCFRRSPAGAVAAKNFDAALGKLDVQELEEKHFKGQ